VVFLTAIWKNIFLKTTQELAGKMEKNYLTQEGFDKLQKELDFLRKERRQEVAARLREASDGEDLIENAEYEAAKNEQAFVEGRIKELEILLATARIITESNQHDLIQVGSKVTIQEEGIDQKESFVIVGAAEANPSEGKISNESPLGKALLGHKKDDDVTVEAPNGSFNVKILKIS
jgi:transcription elongation factor GreA